MALLQCFKSHLYFHIKYVNTTLGLFSGNSLSARNKYHDFLKVVYNHSRISKEISYKDNHIILNILCQIQNNKKMFKFCKEEI